MEQVLDVAYARTMGLKKDLTVADPYDVVPLKDRKCAKETAEVYLSNRGAQSLINFDHFLNLEVLWLNGNKLRAITGLDLNFRIKELYLHDNQIKTLEGSLPKLVHLRTITLYNNELSDLDLTLSYFKPLPYLTHLDLFDNPLSQEQNYRKRVVNSLKHLQLFDRHTVLSAQLDHRKGEDRNREVHVRVQPASAEAQDQKEDDQGARDHLSW